MAEPPRPFFVAAEDDVDSDSDREQLQARPPSDTMHPRRDTDAPPHAVDPSAQWSPITPGLQYTTRPPPSSFPFPFQAYPGNPDPGTAIPGLPRRYSFEMRRSSVDSDSLNGFPRPYAPFMAESNPSTNINGTGSSSSIYRQSVAAAISQSSPPSPQDPPIPRTNSAHSFRAPFLSPASRPSSSLWSPPSYPQLPTFPSATGSANGTNPHSMIITNSPSASTSNLAQLAYPYPPKPTKKLLPSTRLAAPLTKKDKPWLTEQDFRTRLAWWITLILLILGIAGAAIICFFGLTSLNILPQSSLCPVLSEDFSSGSIDTDSTWSYVNSLSGFGVGSFQIASSSSTNSFIRNNQLYIYPTLTSLSPDSNLNSDQVKNGANYTVPDCTEGTTDVKQGNRTVTVQGAGCSAGSSDALGKVINPVMSARLSTRGKHSIKYGKVEIRAKLPRGDWLWPSISMYPEDTSIYGNGPKSGRIDILSSRGNSPSNKKNALPLGYTSGATQAGLNFGPFEATPESAGQAYTPPTSLTPSFLAPLSTSLFGWVTSKRASLDQGFHTYGMELTPEFTRFWVDGRVRKVVEVQFQSKGMGGPKGKSIFERGNFPKTARNGSSEVVVENPWAAGGPSAPFDQPFYLVIDLAAGGTNGWFPDNLGNKPWIDGSQTAMRDFLNAQDDWYQTWPESEEDRSFRIDSVKMWKICNID